MRHLTKDMLAPKERNLGRWAGQRGFSLIELIVVVIIITVLAALAIPSILERLRDRRTQEAAHRVTIAYRNARMRALGRGSAVLVRYQNGSSPQGQIVVREAQNLVNACQTPIADCTINWNNNTESALVSDMDLTQRGEYADVYLTMNGPAGSGNAGTVSFMDVCFLPTGRSLVRFANAGAWTPLAGAPTAEVTRKAGGVQRGITRNIVILPNGQTRVVP